jgi:hypothetical protein
MLKRAGASAEEGYGGDRLEKDGREAAYVCFFLTDPSRYRVNLVDF